MSAHTAKQTGISTTIADLHCPEQLIIWAIRHWLDGSHNWPDIQQMFWQACGITNVEDALQGFQNMVGVVSDCSLPSCEGLERVTPCDPDNSYLVWKLEDNPGIQGSRMPRPPFSALPQSEIDRVRAWIAAGAQQ